MPRYGNLLEALPESALGLPSLKELWLEGNPVGDAGRLRPADAEHHLALGLKLRSVGLDQWQVSGRQSRCLAAVAKFRLAARCRALVATWPRPLSTRISIYTDCRGKFSSLALPPGLTWLQSADCYRAAAQEHYLSMNCLKNEL